MLDQHRASRHALKYRGESFHQHQQLLLLFLLEHWDYVLQIGIGVFNTAVGVEIVFCPFENWAVLLLAFLPS